MLIVGMQEGEALHVGIECVLAGLLLPGLRGELILPDEDGGNTHDVRLARELLGLNGLTLDHGCSSVELLPPGVLSFPFFFSHLEEGQLVGLLIQFLLLLADDAMGELVSRFVFLVVGSALGGRFTDNENGHIFKERV